jgi:hypothetical protein
MGSILAKTKHVSDVIKKEDTNLLCKECFERLQLSMRYQKTPSTPEHRLKISIGRLNSPIIQAKKEETKKRKELEKQIREQIKAEEIARRGWIRNSPEARRKISLAHKGQTPWNKGVEAWNRNKPWPDIVKENISRGMIAYWIQRKEG